MGIFGSVDYPNYPDVFSFIRSLNRHFLSRGVKISNKLGSL